MEKVKNNMVSMDWDAKGFIETKKAGFISAVHSYNGVAVAFRDGKVYTHIDDEGNNLDFADLVATIKTAHKSKDVDYPDYYDDYAEIYDGLSFSDTLEYLGIAEYKDDILARLSDLEGYWEVVEERM